MKKNRYSIIWDDPLWMSVRRRLSEATDKQEESREETPLSGSGTRRPDTAGISERTSETESRAAEGRNGGNAGQDTDVLSGEIPAQDSERRGMKQVFMENFSGGTERTVSAPRSVEREIREAVSVGRASAWSARNFLEAGLPEPAENATAEAFRPADPAVVTAGRDFEGRSSDRSGSVVDRAETAGSVQTERTAIERIVDERLSSLRVYVLESDITEAQNSVKTMVDRASF